MKGIKKDGTKLGFKKGHPCYHYSTRKPENWILCLVCSVKFYRPSSRARAKYCSPVCKGISQKGQPSLKPPMVLLTKNCLQCSKEFKTNKSDNCVYCSHKCSTDHLRILRLGSNNPAWRGGVYPINQILRNSFMAKNWRKEVFKRDNYTCVLCRITGVELNADHIKSWAMFPELRFDLDNGRTLCVPCHKKTPNYKRLALTNAY